APQFIFLDLRYIRASARWRSRLSPPLEPRPPAPTAPGTTSRTSRSLDTSAPCSRRGRNEGLRRRPGRLRGFALSVGSGLGRGRFPAPGGLGSSRRRVRSERAVHPDTIRSAVARLRTPLRAAGG